MDEKLIEAVRTALALYVDGKGTEDTLTIHLINGEKFEVHSCPGVDEISIWFQFIDRNDDDVSVRFDQIAAIRAVEGGAAPRAMVM